MKTTLVPDIFIGRVGEVAKLYLRDGQRAARLPCGRILLVEEGKEPLLVDRDGVRTKLEFS